MEESSAAVLVEQQPKAIITDQPASKDVMLLTPEEMVAKAIAPVKREFLRPPPPRNSQTEPNDDTAESNGGASKLVKDKKSKRQLKRERQQEQKLVVHICPIVAKTGEVDACPYGQKCRNSHDIEAYKAQKPADLEGRCPFIGMEGKCPYGLSCRFWGSHQDGFVVDGAENENIVSEMNMFKKDVQKLLWKNKMRFPKADAVIKSLGLQEKSYYNKKNLDDKEVETIPNGSDAKNGDGCCAAVNDLNVEEEQAQEVPEQEQDNSAIHNAVNGDRDRPSKKLKPEVEVNVCHDQSGLTASEELEKICPEMEAKSMAESISLNSDMILKSHQCEKKLIDFSDKLYLAPLTTVGNLPFRRVCKILGADVTCGEMAMCTNLLQGQASEWALLRRHPSETLFGVQICGAFPDTVARTVELIDRECEVDFIDINMGCPIDIVVNKGAGSALLTKPVRIKNVIQAATATVDKPITVKVRTGYFEGRNRIDSIIEDIGHWGAHAVTIHGRSRQQRYSKLADWEYIYQCAKKAPHSLQVLGNGDVFSYLDWNKHKVECPELSTEMIARGALIKPWIFTEIKEQRHWDISSGERLKILKDYVQFGLQHWGSDTKGVETTRHFLLEWLSYTYRYVPVGLLDIVPQKINWRPPTYICRDDLETLMASDSAADWIRISELLLGKVPTSFKFAPKHKSNAYDKAENG
uniref:tRNA-dihydrouridine(47) synthase [NAD(P)(+)] n=1 Tax=Kalanchoe fedtschenkoi TaxID=63787 RepID=A0A7N0SYZ2_KALFE